MPGLANVRFSKEHEKLSLKVSSELNACPGDEYYLACQMDIIEKYAKLLNHKTEQTKWSYCGASCVDGTNLVVQVWFY